jgi:hypothetical protein
MWTRAMSFGGSGAGFAGFGGCGAGVMSGFVTDFGAPTFTWTGMSNAEGFGSETGTAVVGTT